MLNWMVRSPNSDGVSCLGMPSPFMRIVCPGLVTPVRLTVTVWPSRCLKLVSKPGQTIRIKGEGMPKHSTPSEFGDLTIQFSVDFPKEVGSDLAEGLEKLLPQFSAADMRV